PVAEIARENVARLEVAWTYRTGETDPRFATRKPTAFEATPLVVDGTMFVGTPLGRVIALDPATGRERWTFDPQIARDVTYGDFASRGVSTWLDPSAPAGAQCRRRIFVATAQSQPFPIEVRAFDARTGALKWIWDPIPQDAKDPAYGEWRGAMAHKTGAANAWSVLSANPERDLVFVPTGSAAPDYYGALRLGGNRYANSI